LKKIVITADLFTFSSYLCIVITPLQARVMKMNNKIRHTGIIESITDGWVKVRILQTSACAACKVAGHCNAAEAKEKIVAVRCDKIAAYKKSGNSADCDGNGTNRGGNGADCDGNGTNRGGNGAVAGLSVGQEVVVTASRDVAGIALLLGFGLPMVILVSTLILATRVTDSEATAALTALAMLVPYYLIVWMLRERISQRITFQIEALSDYIK
jgi:sigma-E factor negative regulatory protein RseC